MTDVTDIYWKACHYSQCQYGCSTVVEQVTRMLMYASLRPMSIDRREELIYVSSYSPSDLNQVFTKERERKISNKEVSKK